MGILQRSGGANKTVDVEYTFIKREASIEKFFYFHELQNGDFIGNNSFEVWNN